MASARLLLWPLLLLLVWVLAAEVEESVAPHMEVLPERKPCIVTCRTGLCLFEGCNNGPQCPGGSCLFKQCKNADCSGGACTFEQCSGQQTKCDGGGCKFYDHQDTLVKGYCTGEGCTYNNRPHPTFLGGWLSI